MALKTKDSVHHREHDTINTTIELMSSRGTVALYAEHYVDHIKWLQYVGEIVFNVKPGVTCSNH